MATGESKLSVSPESCQYHVSLVDNGEDLSMADKNDSTVKAILSCIPQLSQFVLLFIFTIHC